MSFRAGGATGAAVDTREARAYPLTVEVTADRGDRWR